MKAAKIKIKKDTFLFLIMLSAFIGVSLYLSACTSDPEPRPTSILTEFSEKENEDEWDDQDYNPIGQRRKSISDKIIRGTGEVENLSSIGPMLYNKFRGSGDLHKRCGICHSNNVEGGEFQSYIETETTRINPFTKKPFGRIEAICTSCHNTLHLAHPVGIIPNPKKVILPPEAKGFRGEEDRLTCLGCHYHHPNNKNYKYLRWPSDGGKNLAKYCAHCHPKQKGPDRIFDRENYTEQLRVVQKIRDKKKPLPPTNPYFTNSDFEVEQLYGFYQGAGYTITEYNEAYHEKKDLSDMEWSRARAQEFFFKGKENLEKNNVTEAIKNLESALEFSGDINQDNEVLYLALGRAYQRDYQLDRAEKMFKKAVIVKPNLSEVYFELGAVNKQKNLFDDAMGYFQKAIKLQPNYPEAYLDLGRIYREEGDFKNAREMFETAIRLRPEFSQAYVGIGLLEIKAGDIQRAKENFRKALKIEPDSAEAFVGLGDCFLLEKDYPKALDALDEAISRQETAMAYLGFGKVYLRQNEVDEALKALIKASRLEKKNPVIWYHLGQAFAAGDFLEKSHHAFRRAIKLKKDYAEAWYEIGKLFLLQKKYKESKISLDFALEIRPDYAQAYVELGNCYYQGHELSLAMNAYKKAVELHPGYSEILNNLEKTLIAQCGAREVNVSRDSCIRLGIFYISQKRYKRSLAPFQKAIETDSQNSRSYLGIGKAYTKLERYADARSNLEKARELIPNSAEVHYHLGIVFKVMGEEKKWRSEFSQAVVMRYIQDNPGKDETDAQNTFLLNPTLIHLTAIKIAPENPDLHNNLGTAYMIEGKFQQAVSEYERALKFRPDFPDYYYNIGLAAGSARDYKKAQQAYRSLLRIDPDHFQARYNLGSLYQDQELLDEAIDEYRKILSSRPQTVNISLGRLFRKKWKKDHKREWLIQSETHFKEVLAVNKKNVEAQKNLLFIQNILAGKIQTLIIQTPSIDRIKKIAEKIKENMGIKELKKITDKFSDEAEIGFKEEKDLEKKLWEDLNTLKNGESSAIIFYKNRYFLLYRINSV